MLGMDARPSNLKPRPHDVKAEYLEDMVEAQ
jgi:hypothetical protein